MTFNESDLIAYHLRELSPRRTRALQRALATDPELAAEAEAIAWTLRAFSHAPTPTVDAAVLDRSWNNLRPSLAVLSAAAPSFWRRPLTLAAGLTLAAAAIIGVAFLTTQHIPVRTPSNIATNSAPSTSAPSSNSSSSSSNAASTETSTSAQPSSTLSASSALPTGLSSRPQARAFSGSGAEKSADAAANTHDTTLESLPVTSRNITLASNDSAQAASPATSAKTTAQPGTTIPSNTSETVFVATENAAMAPPLQASLTNSVPLHDSAQTLHTYSATTNAISQAVRPRPLHDRETDISVGGYASLDTSSTSTFTGSIGAVGSQSSSQTITQTIAPAAGVLVAFHQQIRRYGGYQLNTGYSRQSFNTTDPAGGPASLVLANAYEVSAAYVAQGPRNRRVSSHAAAGIAMLNFAPSSGTPSTHHVLRPAGLFTVGLDYHIKHHWSLRAEYRALLFKSPNLQTNTTTVPGYTVSSEPTISLNYRLDTLVRP